MPIIDWSKRDLYPDIRKSIWIFLVTSFVLTSVTLYSWRCWYLRDLWKRDVNSKVDEIMAKEKEFAARNQQVGDDSSEDSGTKHGNDEIKTLMMKGQKAKQHRKQVQCKVQKKSPYPSKQLFRMKHHYALLDEEAMVHIVPQSEELAGSTGRQNHTADEQPNINTISGQTSDRRGSSG